MRLCVGKDDPVMSRRMFINALAGGLLPAPLGVQAQQARRIARIGVLSPSSAGSGKDDLTRVLQEFGYVDGRNAAIEWRWADSEIGRLTNLAAELVRLNVDVIVARGSEATQAAKQATKTIPIVFSAGDPVGTEFVQSLARPEGNLTGISYQQSDLAAKYLQLLRDVLPDASELAVLWSPTNASTAAFLRGANTAAEQLRFEIHAVAIANAEDLEPALAAIARARPRAMIVPSMPMTIAYEGRISEFAIKHHIATLTGEKSMVERGQLMFYGPTADSWRQVADYVDKILKGAKPGDLPVQQPTKFELVINIKTAKALGLMIPRSVLLRADELLQ